MSAELLPAARAALAAGQRDAAKALLLQAVRSAPTGEAWHLLAQCLDDPAQQADCHRRAAQLGYSPPPPAPAPAVQAVPPPRPLEPQPEPQPAPPPVKAAPVAPMFLAAGGSLALALGVFAPLLTLAGESVSFIGNGKGDGTLVLVAGVIGLVFATMRRGLVPLVLGLSALIILGIDGARVLAVVGEYNATLGYGAGMLVVGACLMIIGGWQLSPPFSTRELRTIGLVLGVLAALFVGVRWALATYATDIAAAYMRFVAGPPPTPTPTPIPPTVTPVPHTVVTYRADARHDSSGVRWGSATVRYTDDTGAVTPETLVALPWELRVDVARGTALLVEITAGDGDSGDIAVTCDIEAGTTVLVHKQEFGLPGQATCEVAAP